MVCFSHQVCVIHPGEVLTDEYSTKFKVEHTLHFDPFEDEILGIAVLPANFIILLEW